MTKSQMKAALAAKRSESSEDGSHKWLKREDFYLAVEDCSNFQGSFESWKNAVCKGRLIDGKMLYLASFLEWESSL